MKRLLLAIAVLFCASSVDAGDYVRGYVRRDGTYVAPHYRSSPDSSIYNNYNYNPYRTYRYTTPRYYSTPSYYQMPSYPRLPSYYPTTTGWEFDYGF